MLAIEHDYNKVIDSVLKQWNGYFISNKASKNLFHL